ncbi:MAG: hypothetical protein ACRDYC_09395, partial [Acidimicrobiales bacterium]
LSDGTKLVADGRSRRRWGNPPDFDQLSKLDTPPEPILSPSGGGMSNVRTWRNGFWATPLPPSGPLRFVVEWPDADLPETSVTIEAEDILQAAATAESIWEA